MEGAVLPMEMLDSAAVPVKARAPLALGVEGIFGTIPKLVHVP